MGVGRAHSSVKIKDEMNTTTGRRQLLRLLACLLLCGGVGVGVAVAWSAPRPIVRFVKAPPARTTSNEAAFRFKTRATRTWCRRDTLRYRRCRRGVKYTGLAAGRHKFVVKARHAGRTTFHSKTWTILKRNGTTTGTQPSSGEPPMPTQPVPPGQVPTGRRLILDENFDGPAVNPAAWALYNSAGHAGFGLRRPSAITTDGQGNLVITAQMENGQIVSGAMASRLDFTYGRVEFRVRSEPDPTGTMSAVVLTWPKHQNSPEFTENDIYETGPIPNNTRQFESFIHFGLPELGWQKWITHKVDPSQWHTVAMEWYPDLLEIHIDGMLAWSITDKAVIPDILHHATIQLDARATRTLTQPVRMWVDYIRVYQ